MEIDYFSFNTIQGQEITMGLNIQRQFGMTYVNMFSLKENQGPRLSHNLWTAAKAVISEVLQGQNIEGINWVHVVGDRVNHVRFSTLAGQAYKIDLSDTHALQQESCAFDYAGNPKQNAFVWSLEKFRETYTGAIPTKGEKILSLRYPESPMTVFQIPCNHPSAKDGIFNCNPSYIDAEHMTDDFEFLLADTKKVLNQLAQDDPDMLAHADRKYAGTDVDRWLKNNSIDHPADMGHWVMSDHRGFTLSSGNAGLIRLVENLNLPYFPIASTKGDGSDKIRKLIGYAHTQQVQMRPAFSGPK